MITTVMSKCKQILFYFILFLGIGCSAATPPLGPLLPGTSIIDLSHDYSEETIFWPTEKGFRFTKSFAGNTPAGFYYESHSFCTAEHGGTHVDAPVHFAQGKWTLDQIPLEKLIGPAAVIDVSDSARSNRDYQISIEDFLKWEESNGKLPDEIIVLINTGYARFWPDRVRYMGTSKRGATGVKNLHFPGLDPQAARWLLDERKIKAIGLDTPSIDYGQSTLFESHQILFSGNIPAFENLTNLNILPPLGAGVIALPMKIKGGSGGPLRIIAVLYQ